MSDWLQQLSELEQREAQATPAPWRRSGTSDYTAGIAAERGDVCFTCSSYNGPYREDADLIAALRNSATELISRARRAEELEREITWLKNSLGSVERKLSLVRHRCNIRWGEDGLPEAYDVDVAISEARRRAYEEDG